MSDLDKLVEHIEVAQQALEWADKRIQELEAQQKWQEMETAPFDTWFLAYGDPYSEDGAIYVVRKVMEPDWHHKGPHIQTNDGADIEPTHWMPLPPPPAD